VHASWVARPARQPSYTRVYFTPAPKLPARMSSMVNPSPVRATNSRYSSSV
jgi:hypothetical protein